MESFYRSKHELVFVFKKGHGPHKQSRSERHRTLSLERLGLCGSQQLWVTRDADLAMYPTFKPVAMIADAPRACSNRGAIVLDVFGGSGSTLIAAEKYGRRARLVEFDAAYCNMIVRRCRPSLGRQHTSWHPAGLLPKSRPRGLRATRSREMPHDEAHFWIVSKHLRKRPPLPSHSRVCYRTGDPRSRRPESDRKPEWDRLELTTREAILEKCKLVAMKGWPHALNQITKMLFKLELILAKQILEDRAFGRKVLKGQTKVLQQSIRQAPQSGMSEAAILARADDVTPHPDDIIVDDRGYRIRGPVIDIDLAHVHRFIAIRDAFILKVIGTGARRLKRAAGRRRRRFVRRLRRSCLFPFPTRSTRADWQTSSRSGAINVCRDAFAFASPSMSYRICAPSG